MVAEALDIARETYLAILLDRAYGGAVLMGSPMGGVDIEEVAEKWYEERTSLRYGEYTWI
jgi:succinyl-CoA synthetase beta subunit